MTILPILSYLVSINIASFFLFGFDKWKAVHDQRRIREAVLFGLSICGGSVGGLLAMYLFHHKTRKPAFKYGIPVILILQIVIIWLLMRWFPEH